LAEVAQHDNKADCWIAIEGLVYDVTSYVGRHPGGNEILLGCGKEATDMFTSQSKHSGAKAQNELPRHGIGVLAE